MIEIRLAETAEEKKQVFKFRYRVYVEEMGYLQHYGDQKHKMIVEPLDSSARIFVAYQNGQIVGTVRNNHSINSNLEYYPHLYKMYEVVGDAHPCYTSVSTKLMVHKKLRGSTLALRLMLGNYRQLLIDEVKFDFIDCNSHMVAFFMRLGYQIMGTVNHPEYGEGIVMMLELFNLEYLNKVNSPLKRIYKNLIEAEKQPCIV
jgi:hypothetical protein